MPSQLVLQPARPRRRRLRLPGLPFEVALVLPVQVIMLLAVVGPTLMVVWLSLTEWQPTDNIPWYRAEFAGLWNFYDLLFDERFVHAVFRTLFVVAVSVSIELILGVVLALLFLDEWPWRKVAADCWRRRSLFLSSIGRSFCLLSR